MSYTSYVLCDEMEGDAFSFGSFITRQVSPEIHDPMIFLHAIMCGFTARLLQSAPFIALQSVISCVRPILDHLHPPNPGGVLILE